MYPNVHIFSCTNIGKLVRINESVVLFLYWDNIRVLLELAKEFSKLQLVINAWAVSELRTAAAIKASWLF
ncbi:unnamed protein product [Acanthoscelides obtectus]|uniref:Uncharacterized protein n=1 Tax=Acanthoscelides obtectus TaxID=200917 RepID=A0A9P0KV30_ACAOB|nr:unnamed protein product [Acanthoscelides obtectus]CAK1657766.1 hypothetical protein AOBTE_LOCUS20524 [Acanthoscelides obtectus]